MSTAGPIVVDLRAESDDLDAIVAGVPVERWAETTPAPGWTIAHQIAHLLWTDRVALTSVTDEAGFAEVLAEAAKNPTGFVDAGAEELAALPPDELLADWRQTRTRLHDELLTVVDGRKLPWFGPPMSAASMATARLMETWAHGLDVADALGIERGFTPRLRHVAHLGYRTIGYGFAAHGRPVPAAEIRVELSTPDGSLWTFGPDSATEQITGPALDFCLLVTQRAHPADLALKATGPVAAEWLDVAQVFAGPPGAGRPPKPAGR
jgi:uncharacterized protein (TIGR03084 family)